MYSQMDVGVGIQAKLIYVRTHINEIMRDVMEENEDLQELVINMNRQQLSEKGIDSKGAALGTYSDSHARARSAAGLQTDFIDLKFGGAFQDEFIIEDATGDVIFSINSENWKRDILVERLGHRPGFGEDIFGLTEEHLQILKERMAPHIKAKINNILNA